MKKSILIWVFALLATSRAQAEPTFDCTTFVIDGYNDSWQPCCIGTGQGSPPTPVTVVKIDGFPVQVDTANAFIAMANAAANDPVNPVTLSLAAGMRTMDKQMEHWQCFLCTKSYYYKMCAEDVATKPPGKSCSSCTYDIGNGPKPCGSCNLAACPGTSNHQTGIALDIITNCGQFDKDLPIQPQVNACLASSNVFKWLMTNANSFGFFRTVTVEPWHWDYLQPGPWSGPCEGGGPVEESCAPTPVDGEVDYLFKDLPPGTWGKQEAELCYAAGITNGCQPDYFCPDCDTTRAMAVTLLIRAAQIPVDEDATPTFDDLTPGAYYVPYVEKAKELGITQGCSPTEFCPHSPVTRKQFAKFLIEALGVPTVNVAFEDGSFTDVDDDWAFKYIETMLEYCITTGCGDGTTFCPNELVPRVMAVVFIARAWDLANSSDCISFCDDANCAGTSYCEDWGACSFSSTCAESGTRARTCHNFACTGAFGSASCMESVVGEQEVCTQDTDGNVVEGWGPWSVCEPTAECATTGSQTKVRIICSNGGEVEATKTEECTPSVDPNCSYCDDAICSEASYCEDWAACTFPTTCAESGTRARTCHNFACTGAFGSASCVDSVAGQYEDCTQDTDGNVVEEWGPWSVCEPTAECATTGSQTKVRIVCSNGAEMEATQVQECTPSADPDCNLPELPDADAPPDSDDFEDAAGPGGSDDADARDGSIDEAVSSPDSDAFIRVGNTDVIVVPGTNSSSGCSGSSSPNPTPWLIVGLVLLVTGRRRGRRESLLGWDRWE